MKQARELCNDLEKRFVVGRGFGQVARPFMSSMPIIPPAYFHFFSKDSGATEIIISFDYWNFKQLITESIFFFYFETVCWRFFVSVFISHPAKLVSHNCAKKYMLNICGHSTL